VTELIDTTEMYLRTIYELEEEGIVPLRARIAERLGHSGPTVSQTVARMERDGLLSVSGDRHLELSDQGRRIATDVMRKHRLAERLLVDVLGLDWSLAHDEACRWEHVISDQVERRILALLGDRLESPYGNPVPGLEDIGGSTAGPFLVRGLVTLADLARDDHAVPATVRRIGEPVQADLEALQLFASLGIVPGAAVVLDRHGEEVCVTTDLGAAAVPDLLAAHVFVERLSTAP